MEHCAVEQASPAYWGTLRPGSVGPDQAQVQTWLNGVSGRPVLAVDGKFGPEMARAVQKFQKQAGLTADGVVGRCTWNALALTYRTLVGPEQVYPGLALRQGQRGATVQALQQDLNQKGGANLKEDGKFGANTVLAVRMYQHCQGLAVDGVAGQETWQSLRSS